MRIIAEVAPTRSRDRLASMMARLRGLVDAVDVPEAPLARPGAHSIAVAHMVEHHFGIDAIAHIRLIDVNWTGFESLLGAALLLGVDEVVVLQGDPPLRGNPVDQISTEEAVRFVKEKSRYSGLRVGAVASLARIDAELEERMGIGADFYLVTRLSVPSQLDRPPIQEARRRGAEVYPYIVVATEKNRDLLARSLNPQLFAPVERVPGMVEELQGLADGVLISVPLDFDGLVEALRLLSKR